MDFANGPDRYVHGRDCSVRRSGPAYRGLFPDQFDVLIESVSGRRWDTMEVGAGNCADAVVLIARATSRGEHVPVSLRDRQMMHRLLVLRSERDAMTCLDPVGRKVGIALDDFRARLGFVSLPAERSDDSAELFVVSPMTPPVVRLRTLQPALPESCPGCGGAAAAAAPVRHAFGSLAVPMCAGCAGAATGLVAALWVREPRPDPEALVIRRAHDVPPLLEVTARHHRWLCALWRLNPGSRRNFLEKW
jgi:hypothetical protein